VNDTQDDRHLHLVRVNEEELVLRHVPSWIQPKGIHSAVRNAGDSSGIVVCLGEIPPARENMKRLGEYIVIDEACENRKDTHKENDIASTTPRVSLFQKRSEQENRLEEHPHNLSLGSGSQPLLERNHQYTRKEYDKSMANITEHHSKEEREGRHCK
jgi:hypothetical protein